MLRASLACGKAGVPSVTLVCEGFVGQARATARGLGLPGLPLGVLPGHTGIQSPEEVQRNVRAGTIVGTEAAAKAPAPKSWDKATNDTINNNEI